MKGMAETKDGILGLSIDDIIFKCRFDHGLSATHENKELYRGFLRRDTEKNAAHYAISPEKLDAYAAATDIGDKKSAMARANIEKIARRRLAQYKLMLFAYLAGAQSTYFDFEDGPINKPSRFGALKVQGNDADMWTDPKIGKMYTFMSLEREGYALPNWIDVINDIGQDQEIARIRGRPITYEKDIDIEGQFKFQKNKQNRKGRIWNKDDGSNRYR